MSEAAKAARKANKAKALRLTSASKDKVDASDFVAQPDINAGIKTGARPISKRAFKRGGKVEGVKPMLMLDVRHANQVGRQLLPIR